MLKNGGNLNLKISRGTFVSPCSWKTWSKNILRTLYLIIKIRHKMLLFFNFLDVF